MSPRTFVPTLTMLTTTLLLGLTLDAQAQRSLPAIHGDGYRITAGPLEMLIAPSRGARIRSLKYEGAELLYQADSTGSPGSMGSTFWPSPQAHWSAGCRTANNNGCWTPPTTLDGSNSTALYSGGLRADSAVSYSSMRDTIVRNNTQGGGTLLRLRKTAWANPGDTSISLRYHIINTSSSKVAFAPWEVTRMTTGGLTFWAKSLEDTIAGNGTSGAALIAMITDTLGVKWHRYDSTVSLSGGTPKFWDGTSEGWFAHVDKSRLLYIKKFQDIPAVKKAPVNENQIEYYTNNNTRSLIEMELQGAFDSIAVNDSMTWDVKWYVRRVPDNIAITRNSQLLALVRNTVTPVSISGRGDRRSAVSPARLSLTGRGVNLNVTAPLTVSLELVNARGVTMQRLHSGLLQPGSHAFTVEATPKGVYWLVLKGADAGILETRMLPRLD